MPPKDFGRMPKPEELEHASKEAHDASSLAEHPDTKPGHVRPAHEHAAGLHMHAAMEHHKAGSHEKAGEHLAKAQEHLTHSRGVGLSDADYDKRKEASHRLRELRSMKPADVYEHHRDAASRASVKAMSHTFGILGRDISNTEAHRKKGADLHKTAAELHGTASQHAPDAHSKSAHLESKRSHESHCANHGSGCSLSQETMPASMVDELALRAVGQWDDRAGAKRAS